MNSFWINQANSQAYPTLSNSTNASIVIIGGGLCGLATAYYLAQKTKDIIIVEANQIAYGASGRSTGKISAQHGYIYHDLLTRYGKKLAKQYYEENTDALAAIDEIIKKHAIACDFEYCDATLYAMNEEEVKKLEKEYQAYLCLDIPCTYQTANSLQPPMLAKLTMHHQARFNPYRYAIGLASYLTKEGVRIFEHSALWDIKKADDVYHLYVKEHSITAHDVVFATQFPFLDDKRFYFTRMYSEQEQIIAFSKPNMKQQMLLHIGNHPVQSIHAYHDYTLIAGNSHKSGQMKKNSYTELQKLAQAWVQGNFITQWSSQDYITFDKLPMIGYLSNEKEHLYFASGFQKWGNTTSHIAGKRIATMIFHQPYQENIFAPARLSSFLSLSFVKENGNVLYEFFKRKRKAEDTDFPSVNEGKIMNFDDHLYGVYCDEHNMLFIVDITCPHAGCICNFNTVDKTWDCPCHGSRFSYQGDIIKGPAQYHLNAFGDGFNTLDLHFLLKDDDTK